MIKIERFEERGMKSGRVRYYLRVWDHPSRPTTDSGFPLSGHGLTFWGSTSEEAERHALEFLNNAQAALRRSNLKVV